MASSAIRGLAAGIGIGAVVVAGIFLANSGPKRAPETVAAALPAGDGVAPVVNMAPTGDTIVVYKSPTCGCCGMWVTYMREQGFTVVVNERSDEQMNTVKATNGVSPALASCHTALIHGYVIEGHVPAPEIRKMLAERPKIAGLAVPGMVDGPPGMAGSQPVPYTVVAFTTDGKSSVYASH